MKKVETVDYHIKVVWHAISRMYNQGGSDIDITASSGFVLLNIDVDKGSPATKIAPKLGMESRSLSRMLKNMEENDLIVRKRDELDKRSVRIFLTEKGKEKRDFSKKAVIHFNERVREVASPEELDSFFSVMEKIDNLIEVHRKSDYKIGPNQNE